MGSHVHYLWGPEVYKNNVLVTDLDLKYQHGLPFLASVGIGILRGGAVNTPERFNIKGRNTKFCLKSHIFTYILIQLEFARLSKFT